MYQRINQHAFIEAFRTMGRYDRQDGQGGNFTYEALVTLFDYLEEYEDSTGKEMQFYPIALCCEFTEYDDIEELAGEYDDDDTVSDLLADLRLASREVDTGLADLRLASREVDTGLADELRADLLDWFREKTPVIEIPGTDRIIIQQF